MRRYPCNCGTCGKLPLPEIQRNLLRDHEGYARKLWRDHRAICEAKSIFDCDTCVYLSNLQDGIYVLHEISKSEPKEETP